MFNKQNILNIVRKSIGTYLGLAKIFLTENQRREFLYDLLVMICKEVNLNIPKTIEFFQNKYEGETSEKNK